jgi:hypothetical protein
MMAQRFALMVLAGLICGWACNKQSTNSCALGSERCSCYPNLTCNAGLRCYSSVCVVDGRSRDGAAEHLASQDSSNVGGSSAASASAGGSTGSGGESGVSSSGGSGGRSEAGTGGAILVGSDAGLPPLVDAAAGSAGQAGGGGASRDAGAGQGGTIVVGGAVGGNAGQAGGSAAGGGGAGQGGGGAGGGSGGTIGLGGSGGAGRGGAAGTGPGGSGGSGGVGQGGTGGSSPGGSGGIGGTGQGGTGGTCVTSLAPFVFYDNFECGASRWTPQPANAFALAKDGTTTYQESILSPSLSYATAGSATWTNMLVEVQVRVTSFGTATSQSYAAIYGRFVDPQNYTAVMWLGNGAIALSHREGGAGSDIYDMQNILTPDRWYTLRLEMSGTTTRIYLDLKLIATAVGSTVPSGRIAIGTYNATARFDEVRVTLL